MRTLYSQASQQRLRRQVLGWLLAGNLILALLLAASALLSLRASREAFRERAQIATLNLAESLQGTIAAEIDQVDIVLRQVAQTLRRAGGPQALSREALQELLTQQQALVGQIQALRLADARGQVIAGPDLPAGEPVSVADREAFRSARDEAHSGLLLTGPLQARISQQWSLSLARRVETPDGHFAGLVYALLPTAHLQRLLDAVNVGEQGAATLRTADLRLVARHAAGDGSRPLPIGDDKVSAELRAQLAGGAQRGSYIARTLLDQVERSNTYYRVRGYPLVVVVGLGMPEFLAPWYTQSMQLLGLSVLILLLVAVASALLYTAWRRQASAAQRVHALLHTASDGIHVLDAQGRVVELSDSFAEMLGCTPEKLMGRHVSEWNPNVSEASLQRWLADFEVGSRRRFEARHRHADGSLHDVELQCARVRLDGADLVFCAARDISEYKRASAELQQALQRQQAMLDNELIGILITREQQIVWTNAAMRRILACGEEVLEGQSLRTLHPDEASFQRVLDEALPVLQAGGRYRSQLRARRRDGQPLWIDMHGTLMPGQPQEALWLLADITLLKDSELRAAHSAQHDPLTGLPNRLLLDDRLLQALSRAERSRESLAVCYLDLDGFKAVNDRLGHAAGDRLLCEMAQRLQACVRAQDTVARLGGDEFVLLLPAPGEPAELEAVLSRVSTDLSRPVLLDGQSAQVSASMGVALYPQDGHQADALLAQADRAMYQAKRQGRQRVCYSGAALPAL